LQELRISPKLVLSRGCPELAVALSKPKPWAKPKG